MERVFGEVRNHLPRPPQLLICSSIRMNWGKILMLKYETELLAHKDPRNRALSYDVIKGLPLGVASLVANLPTQIFCNWN